MTSAGWGKPGDGGRFSDRSEASGHCRVVMDSLPNTTGRCAFAAIALLLVVGCTTEETSSGCTLQKLGFSNASQSELGVGSFKLEMKASESASPEPIPIAIGAGSKFALSFEPYDDTDKAAFDYTLLSANTDMLEKAPGSSTFTAKKAGIVAVLATSSADPKQVLDLVHLRVLAPTKMRFGVLPMSRAPALDRGLIEAPPGESLTFDVEVTGEVDEANGPIPDAPFREGKAVGETITLEGIPLVVTSSNEKVVTAVPLHFGEVTVTTMAPGEADLKVTAGDLSRTIHVFVTKSGGAQ